MARLTLSKSAKRSPARSTRHTKPLACCAASSTNASAFTGATTWLPAPSRCRVYSLSTIDHEVQQIGEDVDFVLALLVADVGEGELSEATVDISTLPTRET